MSMNYSVYIGPFLRCEGGERADVYELLNDRLTDGRGELSSDDAGVRYLTPNVEYGTDRQDYFGRHDETPVLMQINQTKEILTFQKFFAEDIEKIRGLFSRITIEWGVVPSCR
jgi:hypothetical protein